jgi:hypothetical protein
MRKPAAGSALAALLTLLVWSPRGAWSAAEDGLGDWGGWDLEERIAAVNEGDLHFLPPEAAAGHHVHHNRIRIDRSSLRGGWVALEQCHERLDAVPAAQILFNAERIRRLRIASAEGIGRAWVEGHSVQLEDVGRQARLCIAAESRALHDLGDGRYRLRNGPYMRRFLDGYYPMGVVLEVHYPTDSLRFEAPFPGPQTGFEVRQAPGEVRVEAAFEGRLITCMDFLSAGGAAGGAAGGMVQPRPAPPCGQDQVPVPLE